MKESERKEKEYSEDTGRRGREEGGREEVGRMRRERKGVRESERKEGNRTKVPFTVSSACMFALRAFTAA